MKWKNDKLVRAEEEWKVSLVVALRIEGPKVPEGTGERGGGRA